MRADAAVAAVLGNPLKMFMRRFIAAVHCGGCGGYLQAIDFFQCGGSAGCVPSTPYPYTLRGA